MVQNPRLRIRLRNFRERVDSQARLDLIADAPYIGMPYFQPYEAEMLKTTTIDGHKILEQVIQEVLDERLERRLKKRVESEDYRVCAAHDLAPIFENAFNIRPKDLAKDQEFIRLLENSGLKLADGEAWTGLSRRLYVNQGQKQKKKKKKR